MCVQFTFTVCVSSAQREKKRVLDSLELELKIVGSPKRILGAEVGSSARPANALKCKVVSLAPLLFIFVRPSWIQPIHWGSILGSVFLPTDTRRENTDSYYSRVCFLFKAKTMVMLKTHSKLPGNTYFLKKKSTSKIKGC